MRKRKHLQLLLLIIILAGLLWNDAIFKFNKHYDNEVSRQTETEDLVTQIMDSQATLAATQEADILTTVWENFFDWSGDDFAWDVVRCNDNGFCVAGHVENPTWADAVLIRTDSTGQHLWNYTYGWSDPEYMQALVECSDGGFAVVGQKMNLSGPNYGWLLKTNSTGHQEWNRTYSETLLFIDIIEVSSGGFLMTGWGRAPGQIDLEVSIVRVDIDGNEIWKEHYGGSGTDEAWSVIELSTGGFLVAGSVETPTSMQYDALLMKIDNDGTLVWHRTYGSEEQEQCTSVIECEDGGFLLTGGAMRDSNYRLWITKTDMYGNQMWSRIYSGYQVGYDIEYVGSNRYAVAARKRIVYIDLEGNLLWESTIGMSVGMAIVSCENKEIVATGWSSGFDIRLARIPWLDWNETATDQVNEYHTPFELDLNATCSTGIASWSVNDTSNFQVDSLGIVSNITTLDVGNYAIEVT
ncbi:MAG: hypothetical protein KAU48_12510, partial [Candidatus Thorarchaeota archaeon]|nr:hypothetical protein [Candidatus Thorarchaeota archaeon]